MRAILSDSRKSVYVDMTNRETVELRHAFEPIGISDLAIFHGGFWFTILKWYEEDKKAKWNKVSSNIRTVQITRHEWNKLKSESPVFKDTELQE